MMKVGWHRWERAVYILILILALFSRFYVLGDRAISHDESIHTKFSWNLFVGDGFQHNPMMHGPLLFEATALMYSIFGVSDFTSRIFVAMVGVALVMSPILLRKWMGKYAALIASIMLLISPSISYYSRYIRHDIPLALTVVLLLWVICKYLDDGIPKWLYWLAAFFSLMYTTKEASYIYTAIFGVLLAIPFMWKILTSEWQRPQYITPIVVILIIILILGSVFVLAFRNADVSELSLDEVGDSRVSEIILPAWGRLAATCAFCLVFVLLVLVRSGMGSENIQHLRLYDVLVVIGSLTLPLGSAMLMKYIGGIDMETVYEAVRSGNLSLVSSQTLITFASVLGLTLLISVAVGLWWNRDQWLKIALIHYSIFFVAYTTIFTWGFGAVSGLVGGLAYWLAQQGVKRGNQPYYYYVLIGFLYDFLPLVFSIFGGGLAVWLNVFSKKSDEVIDPPKTDTQAFFPLFLTGWTLISWVAYTWAGEKMPWLFVHIALPSILLSSWLIGRMVEKTEWVKDKIGVTLKLLISLVIVLVTVVTLFTSASNFIEVYRLGISPGGLSLIQLRLFGKMLGAFVIFILSATWMIRLQSQMRLNQLMRLIGLFVVLILTFLTIRTSVFLNFINYDLASEFMVYAHGTPDIKIAFDQIEDISWRVTGTPHDIKVAYGEDGSWPLTWYMVDYPNNHFYSSSPDAEVLPEYPVIIAGSAQYAVVEDIIGDAYIHFDYKYLWWPIQDYYDLNLNRITDALKDKEMRTALWKIVWNRDYSTYAELKNPEAPFTFQKWPYRKEFRLYVKEDLAAEVWNYKMGDVSLSGLRPVPTLVPDPFKAGERLLNKIAMIELPGAVLRGMDYASDGSIYVADTANHRIWHVTTDGAVLDSIGSYGVEYGQFIEPWDVTVDENGNIYVADTWNHRIQKFDQLGEYITSWGTLAQVSSIGGPGTGSYFYGPRGIAYNGEGELFVTDTGNKRVQVFDINGNFLREFGGAGSDAGYLDEPVGIDIGQHGLVTVVDTWNHRIQVFTQDGIYIRQWSIPLWDTYNPDEKPFVHLGDDVVFVSDAVRSRILAFDTQGHYLWALSADAGAEISFPQGLYVAQDALVIADAHDGKIITYQIP